MEVNLDDVRVVLERDEIVPFFQPIVELRTGSLCGFEVLARWLHPSLGPILPKNFMSLAESSGLMEELTRQIAQKTFSVAAAVPASLFLAVNISPSELCSGRLPLLLSTLAEQSQFSLRRLVIELTEAVLLSDSECARDTITELRRMGCRLALDDFGTGHSSLSYLQRYPFYGLKIDRTFVEPMIAERQSRKIVASVVGLSNSLGMRSVGEGVENDEQADMLLWLGCDMAQGWLYGHPGPAEHLPKMIQKRYSSAVINTELEDDGLQAYPALRLAQLQAIYRGVPVGLCFIDVRQRYVSLNQKYADFVGKPRSAFVGRLVQDMIPEVYPVVQPLLARALNGESILIEDIPLSATETRPTAVNALISYEPVRDEVGDAVGVSVAILNTSEIQGEDVLQPPTEEDAPFETSENDLSMSWVRDASGNLTEVSPKWIALTGMTREQSLNLGSLEAIHPDDRTLALSALREAVQSRTSIDVTCRVRTRNGDYRWLRARGYPRFDSENHFLGWYGGAEDLEERKNLEQALHKETGPLAKREPSRSELTSERSAKKPRHAVE